MNRKGKAIDGDGPPRPSLSDLYPTIARWASGYGWVEFGIDGRDDRPFARALDEGGTVWESEDEPGTLDEGLRALEEGLVRFMKEEGFDKPSPPIRAPSRKAKPTARRSAADPMARKAEKLGDLAATLRLGENFSITRLTILKGLCKDRAAAGAFALFLARRAQQRMRKGKARQRYRRLVAGAVRGMRPYLAGPDDERKRALDDLLREMRAEQDKYENIPWGVARIIKDSDLLIAEECLRAVLHPDEAPNLLYRAARTCCEKYSPHYGTGLIPSSASMVQEIADFWRKVARRQE